MFLDRWSPRAFDGSAISQGDLETILEAGRWAPSAFNYQPWRFLWTRRDDANWAAFLDLLIPFNRAWAQNASALVFIASERTMGGPDRPSHSHSFDAGAAWAYMSIQAHLLGYRTRGMSGLDFEKAREGLRLPDDYRLEAAFVIGKSSDAAQLPEKLRAREGPSDRKPLADLAFAGKFVA